MLSLFSWTEDLWDLWFDCSQFNVDELNSFKVGFLGVHMCPMLKFSIIISDVGFGVTVDIIVVIVVI